MLKQFKDFAIINIIENYNITSIFSGTFCEDETIQLTNVIIKLEHNNKKFKLAIKPKILSYYHSYNDDEVGNGVSKEILIDLIKQIHSEDLTFADFVNYYTNKYNKYNVELSENIYGKDTSWDKD